MHCSQFPAKWMGTGTTFSNKLLLTMHWESPSPATQKQKKGHVLPSEERWGLALYSFRAKLDPGNCTQLSDFTCITLFAVNWGWLDWVHCCILHSFKPSQHKPLINKVAVLTTAKQVKARWLLWQALSKSSTVLSPSLDAWVSSTCLDILLLNYEWETD